MTVMTNNLSSIVSTALVLVWWSLSSHSAVDAFIIRSVHDDYWATGVGRYTSPIGSRVMAVVTRFHDSRNETLSPGTMMDTDCELLVADITGHWKEIRLEKPQLCVGGMAVLQDEPGTAVILGIEGNKTSLVKIDEIGSETPTSGDPMTFKDGAGKIPVVVNRGNPSDTYIYIAMHHMGGDVKFTGFGATRAGNLEGMKNYWLDLTHPGAFETRKVHQPHIVKIDTTTGTIGTDGWVGILQMDDFVGSATIASMEYSNGLMIVTGSTNGEGDAFGLRTSSNGNKRWDGYVTFINPATGVIDGQFTDPRTHQELTIPALRFHVQDYDAHTFVHDSCMIGNHLYVVGTQRGTDESIFEAGGVFLYKIDVSTRTKVLHTKLTNRDRTGLKIACSDTHFYVGGHIFYYGDDKKQQDMYVMSFNKDTIVMGWDVKIDSTPYFEESRRDELVDLEVNPRGDINVIWNSQKPETGINHLLCMDLQSDDGRNSIQAGETDSGKGGIPVGGVNLTPPAKARTKEEKQKREAIGFGIALPILVVVFLAVWTYRNETTGKEANPEDHEEETPIHNASTESGTGGVV